MRARGSGSRQCLRSRRRDRRWHHRGPRSGLAGLCVSEAMGRPIHLGTRRSRCYLPASISSKDGNLSAMVELCEMRGTVERAADCSRGCGWASWAMSGGGVQKSGCDIQRSSKLAAQESALATFHGWLAGQAPVTRSLGTGCTERINSRRPGQLAVAGPDARRASDSFKLAIHHPTQQRPLSRNYGHRRPRHPVSCRLSE